VASAASLGVSCPLKTRPELPIYVLSSFLLFDDRPAPLSGPVAFSQGHGRTADAIAAANPVHDAGRPHG